MDISTTLQEWVDEADEDERLRVFQVLNSLRIAKGLVTTMGIANPTVSDLIDMSKYFSEYVRSTND